VDPSHFRINHLEFSVEDGNSIINKVAQGGLLL
jgi:hypothetical protein